MYTVKKLCPEEILEHWQFLKPEIEKAMKYSVGESTPFDLCNKGMNGVAEFWVVFDEEDKPINVTVTEVLQYLRCKTLHIITTSGEGWDGYKDAHAYLEDYAREHQCDRIEFWGRSGWEKVIKRLKGQNGETYEKSYVVMSMDL